MGSEMCIRDRKCARWNGTRFTMTCSYRVARTARFCTGPCAPRYPSRRSMSCHRRTNLMYGVCSGIPLAISWRVAATTTRRAFGVGVGRASKSSLSTARFLLPTGMMAMKMLFPVYPNMPTTCQTWRRASAPRAPGLGLRVESGVGRVGGRHTLTLESEGHVASGAGLAFRDDRDERYVSTPFFPVMNGTLCWHQSYS